MVRDEADVIAGTLRHMAGEVDWLLVADNGSTDGTRDILEDLVDELPLIVMDDPDPAYYQSAKMSALAVRAAAAGATWIVPFDADELWYSAHRIRDVLPGQPEPIAIARLFNHLATAVDEPDPDPFRSLVWRQATSAPLPKVAFRWEPGAVIAQGNHGVYLPSGGVGIPSLEIRHFPARSAAQFTRKGVNGAAAYRATDLPDSEGAHWRSYGRLVDQRGEGVLGDIFREHWWYLSPVDAGLVRDPAPYRRWENHDGEAQD